MAFDTKRRTTAPAVLPDTGVLIGYARVSTEDQKLDLQRDALAALGCHRVFEDRTSGARADRLGLAEALSHLRRGDTLVVWRLDRLGRTTHQLVNLLEQFEREGIRLRSLHHHGQGPAADRRSVCRDGAQPAARAHQGRLRGRPSPRTAGRAQAAPVGQRPRHRAPAHGRPAVDHGGDRVAPRSGPDHALPRARPRSRGGDRRDERCRKGGCWAAVAGTEG